MTDQITVSPTLPPAPHVLADTAFLSTLATVERQIAELIVKDAATAQLAAELQSRLTNAGNQLEKARKQLKQPFIEAGRAIDAAAEAPANRIDAAKSALKAQLASYDAEQRRIAAEAERERQRQLRELEAQRQREAEAQRQKELEAAEVARKAAESSKVEVLDVDDDEPAEPAPVVKTETEKQIEALKYAPVAVAAAPVGITYRTTLTVTVIDVNKLPEMFIEKTPRLRAIQATFCAGWKEGMPVPELDGATFEVKREPVSTGRRTF